MNIAITLIALMFLAAAALVVAGVYLLAGLAWSLILAGAVLFHAGIFLRSGLTAHG